MPLGAARIALLAKTQVTAVAEVIRKQVGVTAVGNAQIDTAQSKFGGASALFDGTGDYLKGYPEDLTAFGTNDFTIEGWFRINSTGLIQYILDTRNAAGSTSNSIVLQVRTDNKIYFYSNGAFRITSTSTITTGQWYHIALVRQGGTATLYLDGSSEGTWTGISATSFVASQFLLGTYHATTGAYWNGYMDEFRVSDTARYTTTFTPSTTPFVNDDNTLLLLHMDGTDGSTYFPDDNGVRSKIGIRAVNDTQIDIAQSQFGGSSAYFDGVNDYLIIPGGPGADFSGDFTIEFWWWDDAINQSNLFDGRGVGNGYDGYDGNPLIALADAILITNTSTGDFRVWIDGNDRSTAGSGTLSSSTWTHIAVQRSGGVFNAWVNGTRYVNYTGSKDYTQMFEQAMPIGANLASNGTSTANFPLKGNIDEFRISTVARYTNGSTITVPTDPFQNDSDTYLLLHMDGADGSQDFVDDNGFARSQVGIRTVGNAQVDTSDSKIGGASYLGDGAGDYLHAIPAPTTDIGTGDFTVEAWLYPVGNANNKCWFSSGTAGGTGAIFLQYKENTPDADSIRFSIGTSAIYYAIAADQWMHVACQRSGSTMTMYVNGVSVGTDTNSQSIVGTNIIGAANGGSIQSWNGRIDELRISDIARYSGSFTPPTEPYQNDANTLLLLHMDGTDGSTTFRDDNGTY